VPLEFLSEMRGDMRHAWRALIKSPGFALVGIISMGMAIGLTTNVYSSKWAVLFRDLPAAANAKKLVMLQQSSDGDLAVASYYSQRAGAGRPGVRGGGSTYPRGPVDDFARGA
jgi:hypothetical protein